METGFRRKAPRRDFHGYCGILFKSRMRSTQCLQLGEGGALITLQGPLSSIKQGDHIVITLFLPNIGGISARAICVYRSEKQQAGLQFSELSMVHKVRIREFVSRHKKKAKASLPL